MALNEFISGFVPFDSHEGQRVIREIEADANRATFRVIEDGG